MNSSTRKTNLNKDELHKLEGLTLFGNIIFYNDDNKELKVTKIVKF